MRLLITGASGQLGSYLLRQLNQHDHAVSAWTGSRRGELFGHRLQPVDLACKDALAAAYRDAAPEIIIHAAAMSTVGECFRDTARAELVNAEATGMMAELDLEWRARLVFISTDLVFDGLEPPYGEQATPRPLSVYGRTKADAEQLVLSQPRAAVVRVSLLFGVSRNDRPTFFDQQLAAMRQGTKCTLFTDEWRTPLSVQAAADGLLSVAGSDFEGVLHMGGPERISRLEMGRQVARLLGLDSAALVPGRQSDVTAAEPRPRDVSLDSSCWREAFPHTAWPTLEEALIDFNLAEAS